MESAVDGLEIPDYPINFRGFGFLWEPNWHFKEVKVDIQKLRYVLTYASDADNRKEKFKEVQKTILIMKIKNEIAFKAKKRIG